MRPADARQLRKELDGARTIGPATSWGKKVTKRRNVR
jgi:hypothetical protein